MRKTEMNKQATYFIEIGGYRGAIKINGKWQYVRDTRRINKSCLIRWQGPASPAIQKVMRLANHSPLN